MPIINKPTKDNHPARTIALSFLMVIVAGTLLLFLPISSKSGDFTPLLDAFFTATSATCVTGLVVVDTFSHWSIFGQFVILAMIQIGGLGLVTFVTFFNMSIGKKLGLRRMQLASEAINSEGFNDARHILRTIIKFSLLIEAIGALILMITFVPKFGASGIFTSIFLSISAFCNAGFDILGMNMPYASLTEYYNHPLVLIPIMLLIILGGAGFLVWYDIKNYIKTKHLELHTKVVLLVTAGLIVLGTIGFLFSEWNNTATIGNMHFGDKLLNSIFQSVTCRTAGFNSIDIASLEYNSKFFSIILMFIGAAPGSTGGGVKITTITVIIMAVYCVLKGKEETIILGRRIDKSIVFKALTIIVLSVTVIFTATTIITALTPDSNVLGDLDITFETVSAFATVGLSSGVTGIADNISRVILTCLMFFGRVGPISVILSLSMNNSDKSKKQVVPDGKILVG